MCRLDNETHLGQIALVPKFHKGVGSSSRSLISLRIKDEVVLRGVHFIIVSNLVRTALGICAKFPLWTRVSSAINENQVLKSSGCKSLRP